MIEREPANELAFKGVSDVAGAGDVFFEILVERDVDVLRAVFLIDQFDLPDGRPDRGDVQPVFVLKTFNLLDLFG